MTVVGRCFTPNTSLKRRDINSGALNIAAVLYEGYASLKTKRVATLVPTGLKSKPVNTENT